MSKPNPPAPETLTEDELRRLLKACEGTTFYDRRDMAIIRLLVSTGLRVSECVDLIAAGRDLLNRIVRVQHGKGDEARMVRFDAGTAAALDRYKRARASHRYAGLPWLWIGSHGRMTRKGIPTTLAARAEKAGPEMTATGCYAPEALGLVLGCHGHHEPPLVMPNGIYPSPG